MEERYSLPLQATQLPAKTHSLELAVDTIVSSERGGCRERVLVEPKQITHAMPAKITR